MMQKFFLAPMEGVVDPITRELFAKIGGVDQFVTEFIRVTDQKLPPHVFLKLYPELLTQSLVENRIPVFGQLLGGQAGPMAENALALAQLGAAGIDLNFGCPAPTVNRHDGGATLLKSPQRIFEIIKSVREATPPEIPVTAKMRLGFSDHSLALENALAAESAGAKWITVHARTKTDGYKPPAYWESVTPLVEKCKIPVVANGEIWTVNDYMRCKDVTRAKHFMLGRGAMADPFVFLRIRHLSELQAKEATSHELTLSENSAPQHFNLHLLPHSSEWPVLKILLLHFFLRTESQVNSKLAVARTKQWLRLIARHWPQADTAFNSLKVHHIREPFIEFLSSKENDLAEGPVSPLV